MQRYFPKLRLQNYDCKTDFASCQLANLFVTKPVVSILILKNHVIYDLKTYFGVVATTESLERKTKLVAPHSALKRKN